LAAGPSTGRRGRRRRLVGAGLWLLAGGSTVLLHCGPENEPITDDIHGVTGHQASVGKADGTIRAPGGMSLFGLDLRRAWAAGEQISAVLRSSDGTSLGFSAPLAQDGTFLDLATGCSGTLAGREVMGSCPGRSGGVFSFQMHRAKAVRPAINFCVDLPDGPGRLTWVLASFEGALLAARAGGSGPGAAPGPARLARARRDSANEYSVTIDGAPSPVSITISGRTAEIREPGRTPLRATADGCAPLLDGPGVAAVRLTIAPASAEFGEQTVEQIGTPVPFIVENAGRDPLTGLVQSVSGTDFRIARSGSCAGGQMLAPMNRCLVHVQFRPLSVGLKRETLVVTAGGATATAVLEGTGVDRPVANLSLTPTSAMLSARINQQSPPVEFGVANAGTVSSGPLVTELAGPDRTEFTFIGGCTGPLAPGASCRIGVVFKPSAPGVKTATLVVRDGAPGGRELNAVLTGTVLPPALAIEPGAFEFKPTLVGSEPNPMSSPLFRVTNRGDGPATVMVTVNSREFVVLSNSCQAMPVPPGGQCTLTVGFSPASPGPRSGVLTVSNGIESVSATLRGTGEAPGLTINPVAHGFGAIPVGGRSPGVTFSVTNQRPVPTGPLGAGLAGADRDQWMIASSTCAQLTLPPGGTCTVDVAFAPARIGPASAALVVAVSMGDQVMASLAGTGLGPSLRLIPTISPPDTAAVELTSSRSYELTNVGMTATGMLAFSLTGPGAQAYVIMQSTCTTLAPGQTCNFTLQFRPGFVGVHEALLTVKAPNGSATLPLTSRGL
jgi:hypothetical protein